jgi:uncharacterized membrane protein YfcA
MEFLRYTFPVSGVETWLWLPPLVAFVVSFFTSMGGVSGAFLLLPFQVSVLGYVSPSVSGTNQLFNIVAIPSGVWQYVRERRMVWPVTWAVIIGTLPGVVIGAWVRLEYLPDPHSFKFFAGLVLLYIGVRMALGILQARRKAAAAGGRKAIADEDFKVSDTRFSLRRIEFSFGGERFSFSFWGVFLLCFVVGIVGGVYGIGGGAIVAPILVAFFHFPVYAVAGAALMGTFVTSIVGVAVYQIMARFYPGMSVAPDWTLGILFGIGGFCGMYLGARAQRHVPATAIKVMLCGCILFVAGRYILDFVIR